MENLLPATRATSVRSGFGLKSFRCAFDVAAGRGCWVAYCPRSMGPRGGVGALDIVRPPVVNGEWTDQERRDGSAEDPPRVGTAAGLGAVQRPALGPDWPRVARRNNSAAAAYHRSREQVKRYRGGKGPGFFAAKRR